MQATTKAGNPCRKLAITDGLCVFHSGKLDLAELGRRGGQAPDCGSPGKHRLGVRCRVWHGPSPVAGKSKTSALWAPDSDAFLCDQHALSGAHITLIFEPNDSGETAVKVIAAPHTDDRRTPIRHEPRGGSNPATDDVTLEPPDPGTDEPH